jgi:hypothetical protein
MKTISDPFKNLSPVERWAPTNSLKESVRYNLRLIMDVIKMFEVK